MTLRTIAWAGLLLAAFAATAPAIAGDDTPAVSTTTATSPATPPATSTTTVSGTPPATTTGGSGQAPTVHGCDPSGCWHNGPEATPPPKKCHKDPSGIELCD